MRPQGQKRICGARCDEAPERESNTKRWRLKARQGTRRRSHARWWSKARAQCLTCSRASSHKFAEPKAAGATLRKAFHQGEKRESRTQFAGDRQESSQAELREDSSETPVRRSRRGQSLYRASGKLRASLRARCSTRSVSASRLGATNRLAAEPIAAAKSFRVSPCSSSQWSHRVPSVRRSRF